MFENINRLCSGELSDKDIEHLEQTVTLVAGIFE